MKLARIGSKGAEKPAILDGEGNYRDLSGIIGDIDGSTLSDMSWTDNLDITSLPKFQRDIRVGACVGSVGKIICIGLNYSDHAAETGISFTKRTHFIQ